jgi:hypothetical protein
MGKAKGFRQAEHTGGVFLFFSAAETCSPMKEYHRKWAGAIKNWGTVGTVLFVPRGLKYGGKSDTMIHIFPVFLRLFK